MANPSMADPSLAGPATADRVACWRDATVTALTALADPDRAGPMTAYLKNVAPFLGVGAPARRAAQRTAWTGLPALDRAGLEVVVLTLWDLPQREFQYSACDLLARHRRELDADFLTGPGARLLTTKPWWDTVDALTGTVVAPVVAQNQDLVDLMWTWLESTDRWLVRTAVQHQRGRGRATDLDLLFAMCDRVASDREFFVAKAVGWALRDAASLDPRGVQGFLRTHPDLAGVARREAVRGVNRAGRL